MDLWGTDFSDSRDPNRVLKTPLRKTGVAIKTSEVTAT